MKRVKTNSHPWATVYQWFTETGQSRTDDRFATIVGLAEFDINVIAGGYELVFGIDLSHFDRVAAECQAGDRLEQHSLFDRERPHAHNEFAVGLSIGPI